MESSMASVSRNQVSNHIPNDIVFDILFKLPLKSLKRFSSVCKFWGNLFENPNFMTTFCKHNNLFPSECDDHLNSRLFLKQTSPTFGLYDDYQYLYFLSGNTFENSVKFDWPSPSDENELIIFVGSVVNGILCLCKGDGRGFATWDGRGFATWIGQKIALWNPGTDEYKPIPNGSIDHLIAGSVFEDQPRIDSIVDIHGFGYDPVADDYKLIRFIQIFNVTKPELRAWQIYSLRSNSWTDLNVNVRVHAHTWNYLQTGYAVHFNGMCHWWGVEDYCSPEVLVSFNLSDEVFITTPFTPNYDKTEKHLVELNGLIGMIADPCESYLHLQISVLGEFGVAESWTKILTIGPLPSINRTIGIGKNGDVFYIDESAEIARCNFYTEKTEKIGLKGNYEYSQMFIYIQSLLPIGGIDSYMS